MGCNHSGGTFDEKVYSLFSRKPPKDADPGTNNNHSNPSVMTCFCNNISPDVMKFIGVLRMVKGVSLSGVTTEELLRIAVAVYLLKQKGEALPKSNSAFYLLKEQDPDKWENFKAWNILKSTPKFLEPQVHASETTEDKEEEVATSPPNEVNVEDQPSTMDASADDPHEEKEEQETMTNVLSTSSYKPSNDSSTTTSLVNVVSHASRQKKQHLG